jgi:hypothetical protein
VNAEQAPKERQADGTFKRDYYLSNCAADVPPEDLARVAKAAHRIGECLERSKGEAGLGDYQVRLGLRPRPAGGSSPARSAWTASDNTAPVRIRP